MEEKMESYMNAGTGECQLLGAKKKKKEEGEEKKKLLLPMNTKVCSFEMSYCMP
jgi:hypothetical protein